MIDVVEKLDPYMNDLVTLNLKLSDREAAGAQGCPDGEALRTSLEDLNYLRSRADELRSLFAAEGNPGAAFMMEEHVACYDEEIRLLHSMMVKKSM